MLGAVKQNLRSIHMLYPRANYVLECGALNLLHLVEYFSLRQRIKHIIVQCDLPMSYKLIGSIGIAPTWDSARGVPRQFQAISVNQLMNPNKT